MSGENRTIEERLDIYYALLRFWWDDSSRRNYYSDLISKLEREQKAANDPSRFKADFSALIEYELNGCRIGGAK